MAVTAVTLLERDSERLECDLQQQAMTLRYRIDADSAHYDVWTIYNEAVSAGLLPALGTLHATSRLGLRQVSITRQEGEAAKYWLATLSYTNEFEDLFEPNNHHPDEDTVTFTVDTVAEQRASMIDYRNVESVPKALAVIKAPPFHVGNFYHQGDRVTYKGDVYEATVPSDKDDPDWTTTPVQPGPFPDQLLLGGLEIGKRFWTKVQLDALPAEGGVDTACKAAIARNTAGDIMSPLPELFYQMRVLRIDFSRTTEGELGNFVASTNSDHFVIGGLRVWPYQAFFKSLRTSGPHYRNRADAPTTRWAYDNATKGWTLLQGPGIERYYKYTVEFEFFQVPKPCNMTILDPARTRRAVNWNHPNADNRVQTLPLLYPGTNTEYDWIPYGELAANVGFNAWFEDGKDASEWTVATEYVLGDKVYTGQGSNHETYVCIGDHTAAAADKPPNAFAADTGGANWREYWLRANNGKYTRRPILWKDVSGQMLANVDTDVQDTAAEKIEQEVQLDEYGSVLPDQSTAEGVFALYFRKARLMQWTDMPWFHAP